MAEIEGLLGKYRQCSFCGRPLPRGFEGDMCPACMEQELFREVKDFIRSHEVNEYQVAEHFNIPVRVVKNWIKDGRIEYKEIGNDNIIGIHCQRCGSPVSFGTLCPKCLKLLKKTAFLHSILLAQQAMVMTIWGVTVLTVCGLI